VTNAAAPPAPHQLTQADAYALWYAYGGVLDAVERNCLNKLLEEMAYAEQEVQDARADVGDGCYRGALRALERLLARRAAGAAEAPPRAAAAASAPRRRTVQEIVAGKQAEQREAGKYGALVARALKKNAVQ